MELTSHTVKSARTRATPDQTYALLADVPRSGKHFPDVQDVRPVGDLHLWQMKRVGVPPLAFQSEYHGRWELDPVARSVRWASVPGRGNTVVKGQWTIEPDGSGTRFTLDLTFTLAMPLPSILRSSAEKVLAHENGRIIAGYLANLTATLDGLAAR